MWNFRVVRSVFLVALVFAAAGCQEAAPEPKPNILFMVVDDMGTFDVGAYGSAAIQTPNIDRLAAEGMMFTQAYSGCAVCAPARSTLMTGKHMGHTSVRGNSGGIPLLDEDVTVAEVLEHAGYVSGGFGKWGLGDFDTPGVPERQGFAKFFGHYQQVHAHYFYPEYLIDTGKKVELPGNRGFYDTDPEPGGVPVLDPETGLERQFSAYLAFEEMKQFIRENKDRPFFCYAPFTPPHARYEMPENDPDWLLYKDKPWSIESRGHAAFCSMMDRQLGETMALLEELGIDDNTIVVFTSDNGASARRDGELDSSGPLRGRKGMMWEGGLRVPFLVRWPGKIQPGSVNDLPIYFPDFLPTAAELAGVSEHVPAGVDGLSLVDEFLDRKTLDRERPLYWEWNGEHFRTDMSPELQACRRGRWKILRHQLADPWELYDLSQDPGEENNLAAEHPGIVEELAAWVRENRVDARPQSEPPKPEGAQWR